MMTGTHHCSIIQSSSTALNIHFLYGFEELMKMTEEGRSICKTNSPQERELGVWLKWASAVVNLSPSAQISKSLLSVAAQFEAT